jgi:hypothetical protein
MGWECTASAADVASGSGAYAVPRERMIVSGEYCSCFCSMRISFMNYSYRCRYAHRRRRLARLGLVQIMVPTWAGPCRAFLGQQVSKHVDAAWCRPVSSHDDGNRRVMAYTMGPYWMLQADDGATKFESRRILEERQRISARSGRRKDM